MTTMTLSLAAFLLLAALMVVTGSATRGAAALFTFFATVWALLMWWEGDRDYGRKRKRNLG